MEPTIVYAFIQAVGMVDDDVVTCCERKLYIPPLIFLIFSSNSNYTVKKINLLWIALCFFSCNSISSTYVNDSIELYKMTDDYIKENFDDYGHVYDQLKDSLEWRVRNNIYPYHHFILHDWKLDSLLILSADRKVCVAAAYFPNLIHTQSDLDKIVWFRGTRIEGLWYFRRRSGHNYPRTEYQEKKYEPMTFDMLKYILRCKDMRSAYIVNDNGKLEPNEKYLALNHTVKGKQKRNPSTKWDEESWNENILRKEKKRGFYTEEALDKYRRMMQEPRPEEEKESRRTRNKRMKDIKQFQMILDSLGLQYN